MVKISDNTPIEEIDRINNPVTSTMVDRYIIASHWCKNKDVLDASCGHGYGSVLLLGMGARNVTGIDIDRNAIDIANTRWSGGPMLKFSICDIFNMPFKSKFEVCTSIETFEHLPPDRIDEYLQSLKSVTSETIIITTPRRLTQKWEYNGGTHLYEYDPTEFSNILARNFGRINVSLMGLNEIRLPNGQYGTDITSDLSTCRIMMGIIEL